MTAGRATAWKFIGWLAIETRIHLTAHRDHLFTSQESSLGFMDHYVLPIHNCLARRAVAMGSQRGVSLGRRVGPCTFPFWPKLYKLEPLIGCAYQRLTSGPGTLARRCSGTTRLGIPDH